MKREKWGKIVVLTLLLAAACWGCGEGEAPVDLQPSQALSLLGKDEAAAAQEGDSRVELDYQTKVIRTLEGERRLWREEDASGK